MTNATIPSKKVLKRKAQILVNCTQEEAFKYISNSENLPQWLTKLGPIPGAQKVEIIKGPYDFIGAKRKIFFDEGNVGTEELISYDPYANYAYKISNFNKLFGKLTDAAYGQLWFDQKGEQIRISWNYTFTYKNIFARMLLSIILTLFYVRFLKQALGNAATALEKES
ncbi:MAG: SRPBCC family protein [Flavobacteriales bacterium]|nr:SRPBCC family protein [Flavobacteriales bacterium]